MDFGLILRNGDKLCERREMSRELIEEVKNIYKKCQSLVEGWSTPLILAAKLDLENMVCGFIECAKQTNTNLHTGETGEVQKFLWLRDKYNITALDMAIEKGHVGVAKLLLANASWECLISKRNHEGKLPVSMLCSPEHDEFILKILEEAKRAADTPISALISIDDDQQESQFYTDDMNKLHVSCKFGEVEDVKNILEKDSSLIYKRNSKDETPAYVAAREGHVDILEVMFNHLKIKNAELELNFTRSTDKTNAVHIAIQNHHVGVVFWLINKIPQLANRTNDFEESPLYLAAERRYHAIMELMLRACDEIVFEGPSGKRALHAATISGSQECIEHLLSVNKHLLHIKDNCGWAPLHYAVHHNNSLATSALLKADSTLVYDQVMTKDGINTSAIHIAATQGYLGTMKVLMSGCRGCTEIVDDRGRNILHVAIENKKIEVINFIFQHESLTSLINERDNDGNTPIHLLMASELEITEMVMDSRVDVNILNNEKLTPLDMTSSEGKRMALLKVITMGRGKDNKAKVLSHLEESDSKDKFEEDRLKEAEMVLQNILIVVTLIATTTFAAAFTVPGGFQSEEGTKQGTPFLLRKPAFIAFVISNTIAFSSSCSVLFGHMVLVINRVAKDELDREQAQKIDARLELMYYLTGCAMLAMTVAFVTGLYVVLIPSLGLAIFSCVMTLFIIGVTLVFPLKIRDFLSDKLISPIVEYLHYY